MPFRKDQVFIFNKGMQSVGRKMDIYFKGRIAKTISNEAYSIPTASVGFNVAGHKAI